MGVPKSESLEPWIYRGETKSVREADLIPKKALRVIASREALSTAPPVLLPRPPSSDTSDRTVLRPIENHVDEPGSPDGIVRWPSRTSVPTECVG
jgi:hypothetical protein